MCGLLRWLWVVVGGESDSRASRLADMIKSASHRVQNAVIVLYALEVWAERPKRDSHEHMKSKGLGLGNHYCFGCRTQSLHLSSCPGRVVTSRVWLLLSGWADIYLRSSLSFIASSAFCSVSFSLHDP